MTTNEIVIIVRGGNVTGVLSSDPNAIVYMLDFDNAESQGEQLVDRYERDIQHFESVMTYIY